jgi:hypothetical protein
MAKQKLEIECPICDAKLSIDARSCPRCGADLGMADFQDLEDLANDLSEGKEYSEQRPERVAPKEVVAEPVAEEEELVPPKEEPKTEEAIPQAEPKPKVEPSAPIEVQKVEPPKAEEKQSEDEDEDDKAKKKGLFSKLFGKKK